MRLFYVILIVLAAFFTHIRVTAAAGHSEITIIPMGQIQIKTGWQEIIRQLPRGPEGLLEQPVVLIAAQPSIAIGVPKEKDAIRWPNISDDLVDSQRQVPATVNITIGDETLPEWILQPQPTLYVINLDTIRLNREYANGRLAMKFNLSSEAKGLTLQALGMPDILQLNDGKKTALNGLLDRFIAAAKDPEVRAYFTALSKEVAGQQEQARDAYERLRTSKNRQVARFARRGLRMLSYQLRPYKLSGNFMEHYRWGLYLQFCGLFDAAFREFEECRVLDPQHGESQYRAGECLERVGAGIMTGIHYLDRTSEAAKVSDPTIWYVLVTILRSRDNVILSQTQIDQIKDNWFMVEKMVWAATRGVVRMSTVFDVIEDQRNFVYSMHMKRVIGPEDAFIETRGWFDSVISVRPRIKTEENTLVQIGGGEVGPNGTAIAALFHDAHWPEYLKAIYGHLYWAARISEAEPGLPGLEDAIDCGHPPVPGVGYAYRAALRYHFSRRTFQRLDVSEIPVEGSYIQLWKIDGPFRVNTKGAAAEPLYKRAIKMPSATPGKKSFSIVSDDPFIDLAKIFPKAGRSLIRATSWVYSPEDQVVQLRLGQNDGIAVWLNGYCIHRGYSYAGGKFKDKNLVDTIFSSAELKKGWNELQVVTESLPRPRNKGWGFSVAMATKAGNLVPGLAYVNQRPASGLVSPYVQPKVGKYYTWRMVKDDFRRRLPRLTPTDLETITGARGVKIVSQASPFQGFIAIDQPKHAASSTYRTPPEKWVDGQDRDIVLNNVMDWARESCAAFQYRNDNEQRALLLLKLEAVEVFLHLLREPLAAKAAFAGKSAGDRILGYVIVPVGATSRTLLVIDTVLGREEDWPIDEEDLLSPIGEYIPNDGDAADSTAVTSK